MRYSKRLLEGNINIVFDKLVQDKFTELTYIYRDNKNIGFIDKYNIDLEVFTTVKLSYETVYIFRLKK